MSDDDIIHDVRTVVGKGVVLALDDTGVAQTVDVQTNDGVTHRAIEVWQPFGLSSAPPQEGSTVVLLSNGGDRGDLVAMQSCPSGRFGGLQRGETVVYASDGTRTEHRLGGIINVLAATQVNIEAPNAAITLTEALTITAPQGVTVEGLFTIDGQGNATVFKNLTVLGSITANGTITPNA